MFQKVFCVNIHIVKLPIWPKSLSFLSNYGSTIYIRPNWDTALKHPATWAAFFGLACELNKLEHSTLWAAFSLCLHVGSISWGTPPHGHPFFELAHEFNKLKETNKSEVQTHDSPWDKANLSFWSLGSLRWYQSLSLWKVICLNVMDVYFPIY